MVLDSVSSEIQGRKDEVYEKIYSGLVAVHRFVQDGGMKLTSWPVAENVSVHLGVQRVHLFSEEVLRKYEGDLVRREGDVYRIKRIRDPLWTLAVRPELQDFFHNQALSKMTSYSDRTLVKFCDMDLSLGVDVLMGVSGKRRLVKGGRTFVDLWISQADFQSGRVGSEEEDFRWVSDFELRGVGRTYRVEVRDSVFAKDPGVYVRSGYFSLASSKERLGKEELLADVVERDVSEIGKVGVNKGFDRLLLQTLQTVEDLVAQRSQYHG